MINQLVLVGRVNSDFGEIKEEKKTLLKFYIKSTRSYKNANGGYDEDNISCLVRGAMCDTIRQYCGVGDIIGVRGALVEYNNETYVMADKVTFLSNKTKEE